MIPHQEPRFLLPLMIPMFILLADIVWNCVPLRAIWIAFNLIAGLFFGFVHQGGVIPSLSTAQHTLTTQPEVHVAYYQTYIVPQFPLLLPRYESERFVNVGMSDHVKHEHVAELLERKTRERTVIIQTCHIILRYITSQFGLFYRCFEGLPVYAGYDRRHGS